MDRKAALGLCLPPSLGVCLRRWVAGGLGQTRGVGVCGLAAGGVVGACGGEALRRSMGAGLLLAVWVRMGALRKVGINGKEG